MGIRARLFLLIALTLLPTLLLLAWNYTQHYRIRRDQALATELEVAQGVAATFQAYLNDIRLQNHTVGQAILTFERYTEDKATRVLRFAAKQYPTVRNMSWLGPDGRVLASTMPEMVGRNLAERPFFKTIVAGAPWALSDLTPVGEVSQRPTFAVASAIRDESGALRGVVRAGIEPERLGEVTLTQQRPSQGAYAIFDHRGTLIYRNPESPLSWQDRVEWKANDQVLRQVLQSGTPLTGVTRLKIWHGDWISARAPIGDLGWVAGAGRPVATALEPVRRDLFQDSLLALAVFAAAFALAGLIARTIAGPLSRLEREASAVGAGQGALPRENVDATAPAEVRSLSATVAAMAAGLVERAEALRESESTLRSFYESAAMLMGIVEVSEQDEIVHLYDNPAAARFFGSTPEATAGQSARALGAPGEAVKQWVEHYRQSQELGRPVGFEYIHVSPRGPLWLAAHVALIGRAPSGGMRFAYVAEDITQRKLAEEALRQSEETLKAVLAALPVGVLVADAGRRLVRDNAAHRELWGGPPETTGWEQYGEWVGYWPETGERIKAEEWALTRALVKGEVVIGELVECERFGSGERRVFLNNAAPVRDAQGAIIAGVAVEIDITERRRAEEAVREANEKLAEADRRKDEFLAMLAHELRNPLAPIRNAVQIMRIAGSGDPVLQRQRAIVDRQVTHMARLLDDLLDVSRVTRGKITLQRRTLGVKEVLLHALETARPMIDARHHTLHFTPPPDDLCVEGDGDRLAQVVGNLLTNAAKYTEEGGEIWLEATRIEGEALISVRDTGMGIAPEMLGRVFDLFAQADRTLDRSQGGLGIGLTMVRRLAEMHGGTVDVCSEGLGKGAIFVVRLPALPAEEAEEEAPAPALAPDGKGPEAAPSCRVLVVDDVADSAASLAELLEIWSHKTRVACDGASALKAAESFRPNVALLDIGMPGMDGFELARRLRAEHGREIFLVALTGYGQSQDREATQEAGFDAHLVKPVDLNVLSELLAKVAA